MADPCNAIMIGSDGTCEFVDGSPVAASSTEFFVFNWGNDLGIGPFPVIDDAAKATPDAIFFTDLSTSNPVIRFHLAVWLGGDSDHMETFWEKADAMSFLKCGRLGFRTSAARQEFLAWWAIYQMVFFQGADAQAQFLPTGLREGKVDGIFLIDNDATDRLPMDWATRAMDDFNDASMRALNRALRSITPQWAWIAANCKREVRRLPGGWLFQSERDATLFRMFDLGDRTER